MHKLESPIVCGGQYSINGNLVECHTIISYGKLLVGVMKALFESKDGNKYFVVVWPNNVYYRVVEE